MGIIGDLISSGFEVIAETAKEAAIEGAVTLTLNAAVYIGSGIKKSYLEKKRLESEAIKKNYSSGSTQSSYIDSNSQKLNNDAHQCKKCGIVKTVFFENELLRCGYCNQEIIIETLEVKKIPNPQLNPHIEQLKNNSIRLRQSYIERQKVKSETLNNSQDDSIFESKHIISSIDFPKLRKEDILTIEQRKIIARVLVEWMHYAAFADLIISTTEKKVITKKISEIFFQTNSALDLSELSNFEKNELVTVTNYHYSLQEIFDYAKSDRKLIKPFLRIAFQIMNSEGKINKKENSFLNRCKKEFQL